MQNLVSHEEAVVSQELLSVVSEGLQLQSHDLKYVQEVVKKI